MVQLLHIENERLARSRHRTCQQFSICDRGVQVCARQPQRIVTRMVCNVTTAGSVQLPLDGQHRRAIAMQEASNHCHTAERLQHVFIGMVHAACTGRTLQYLNIIVMYRSINNERA
jgi:hypothetical protein